MERREKESAKNNRDSTTHSLLDDARQRGTGEVGTEREREREERGNGINLFLKKKKKHLVLSNIDILESLN